MPEYVDNAYGWTSNLLAILSSDIPYLVIGAYTFDPNYA